MTMICKAWKPGDLVLGDLGTWGLGDLGTWRLAVRPLKGSTVCSTGGTPATQLSHRVAVRRKGTRTVGDLGIWGLGDLETLGL